MNQPTTAIPTQTSLFFSPFFWLKIAAGSVFLGRAYQHIVWDAPYRELLWDDEMMQPFIEKMTPWTWHEYVTSLAVDHTIQRWMVGLGIFYALCAVACFFYEKMPRWVQWPLWLGVAGQIVLAMLYMKEYFLHLGQFFEYALQFSAPAFLMAYFRKNGATATPTRVNTRLLLAMKVATAFTFICHGLYALGFYPRPGSFTTMTINILGCSEAFANNFLILAGWMDMVVAIGIFLPWKWSKWVLLYAIFWGFATTLARIFGNFYWDFPLASLNEWVYQAVYRLPHGLIPLVIFLMPAVGKGRDFAG